MPFDFRNLCRSLEPAYGHGEARAVVMLVLEKLFDMSYADIVCDGLRHLDEESACRLSAVMQRLQNGEPVQYVLGEASFCGRMFAVKEGVLIPRPETEEMTRAVIASLSDKPCARVLDICTGSGCIAVTIAKELPQAEVTAWDISDVALSVAKRNAEAMDVQVNVVSQDALHPPFDTDVWTAIVSNPPYVMESERKTMAPHVLDHEPSLALFVPDASPLLFYVAIARYAAKALVKGGVLFFEINPLCASRVVAMLGEEGFSDIDTINDQFGKQRFVRAYLNPQNLT